VAAEGTCCCLAVDPPVVEVFDIPIVADTVSARGLNTIAPPVAPGITLELLVLFPVDMIGILGGGTSGWGNIFEVAISVNIAAAVGPVLTLGDTETCVVPTVCFCPRVDVTT
jgi:hypothetical protein